MTIRYIDPFAHTTTHEMFNASLLAMCTHVADEVVYIAGRSSARNVMALAEGHLGGAAVRCRPCYVPGGEGRWAFLLRTGWGAVQNVRFLLTARKGETLVYNYDNLFATPAINALNKILRRRVLIFCHGELEALSSGVNRAGLLSRVLHGAARRFFLAPRRRIAEGLRFVVMGERILGNLAAILPPRVAERFVAVDHSYIFTEPAPVRPEPKILSAAKFKQPLRLGTVGVMNRAKGIGRYAALVRALSEEVRERIRFSIVGKVLNDEQALEGTGIRFHQGEAPLPRAEYDRRVGELDAILYFYSPEAYRITASGAVFDAINARKPIVAVRNDYFQYLFDTCGPFGWLLDDQEALGGKIVEMLDGGAAGREWDFDAIRRRLAPEAVCEQLREALCERSRAAIKNDGR